LRRHILREISSNPNAVQLSKNRLPFDKLRANGGSKRSGRTVFPNVLSEVEGSAQGERWVEAPVLSEPSTLRQAQGERWVEALRANGFSECPERSRRKGSARTGRSPVSIQLWTD